MTHSEPLTAEECAEAKRLVSGWLRAHAQGSKKLVARHHAGLEEQLEAEAERRAALYQEATEMHEALTKAPFPSGHDADYTYWFHNGRREALEGSIPVAEPLDEMDTRIIGNQIPATGLLSAYCFHGHHDECNPGDGCECQCHVSDPASVQENEA